MSTCVHLASLALGLTRENTTQASQLKTHSPPRYLSTKTLLTIRKNSPPRRIVTLNKESGILLSEKLSFLRENSSLQLEESIIGLLVCMPHFLLSAIVGFLLTFLFFHCAVYPLIYHDIDVEIPQEHRALITRVYQLWLVLAATLILNMIACIFIYASGSRSVFLRNWILNHVLEDQIFWFSSP